MGYKKIIGILLVFALVLSGCNTKEQTVDTTDESASPVTADTTATSETTTAAPSETEAKSTYKFNPHLYSKTVGDAIPDDYYQALYNLIDALREPSYDRPEIALGLLFFVQSGCIEFSVRTSTFFSGFASSMILPSLSFGFSSVTKSILIG